MDMMEMRFRMMAMMGGKVKLIETGTYTPTEDVYASSTHIPHSLGVAPDFIIVMSEALASETSQSTRYIANAYFSKNNLSASNLNEQWVAWYLCTWPTRTDYWQSTEPLNTAKFAHENNFEVPYYSSSDTLKAGVTYHWVIGKYE